MKRNKRNIRNLVNIVNRIVNQLHVTKWGSHKKHPADLTKIVISNLPFGIFFLLLYKRKIMLSYIGGKSKIGKWIVPFYDKDMETYVEGFSGMFWCFFNMDLKQFPNLKKVVYNDFNPLNYNLFKCIQNPTELLKVINSIDCQKFGEEITPPLYKEQFIRFQAEIFAEGFNVEPGDYEVAAKYVYVLTQVFSGSKPETSSLLTLKVSTNQNI